MLRRWLKYQERNQAGSKFAVIDISERAKADVEIIDYLACELVSAHCLPVMLECELELLRDDASELGLDDVAEYLENHILPGKNRPETRVGNFGEVLGARYLIEFEDFWLPIYKLRYREKKDWAARLTDLCLIKRDRLPRPLVCYGEVKTKSTGCNLELAVDGHESLAKDDALADPEILRFIRAMLYERGDFDEAFFFSEISFAKIEYDSRHDLFLVHDKDSWKDEVLDRLQVCELDGRLVGFSVKVVLISRLRRLIDSAYEQTATAAWHIVYG
jgi:hypothetical protein